MRSSLRQAGWGEWGPILGLLYSNYQSEEDSRRNVTVKDEVKLEFQISPRKVSERGVGLATGRNNRGRNTMRASAFLLLWGEHEDVTDF